MLRKKFLKLLSIITFIAILLQTAACGTLLYPERRGQKHGQLDPAVVILDGVCLIFFIVPGVLAFAVDFITGAIYLPKNQRSADQFQDNKELVAAAIDMSTIDINAVEKTILEKTGKDIDLDTGVYQTYTIENPEIAEKYFFKTSMN